MAFSHDFSGFPSILPAFSPGLGVPPMFRRSGNGQALLRAKRQANEARQQLDDAWWWGKVLLIRKDGIIYQEFYG